MLLVPARIALSQIHGLGVFSVRKIAAETVVWRYKEPIDRHLTMEEVELFPEDFINRFAYRPIDRKYYVLPGDSGMFLNHSNTPNLVINPHDILEMVAATEIKKDEELTVDYRTFSAYPESGGKFL